MTLLARLGIGVAALAPALASASGGGDHAASWDLDPWVLAPVAVAALLHVTGLTALAVRGGGGAARAREAVAFAAGLAAVLAALVSPLGQLSERLLSAHVGQHELLMLVAAPLLVVGRPLVPFLFALPPRWQPRALALARRPAVLGTWAFLTAQLVAVLLHALARWIWHLPPLFDAALDHRPVHALQHLTFLLTAVLLWWSVVHGRDGRASRSASAWAVLVTAAHTGLLAATLALAPSPLYRPYVRLLGQRALSDQRVAGLTLGLPAGALLAIAGLTLLADRIGGPSLRARPKPA